MLVVCDAFYWFVFFVVLRLCYSGLCWLCLLLGGGFGVDAFNSVDFVVLYCMVL